jgi:hypothetical protein
MTTFVITVNFDKEMSIIGIRISTSPFSTSKGLSGRIVYRFFSQHQSFVFDFKTNNFMKVEFVTGKFWQHL